MEEIINVSDIYICVYDDIHVGLFKKIDWCSKPIKSCLTLVPEYNAGSVFVGIDSGWIGIKQTHESYYDLTKDEEIWKPIGTQITINSQDYVANCHMQKSISFDDLRLIMRINDDMDSYEFGKASSKELNDVLQFASDYYCLNQSIIRKRKKIHS